MNWIPLRSVEELEQIKHLSQKQPLVIFKHSTRCSISTVAKNRLEKSSLPEGIPFYFLDLISFRKVSNSIAEEFGIMHESPQILLIKDGKCVYVESHMAIDIEAIKKQLQNHL